MTPQARQAYEELRAYIEEKYTMMEVQEGGPSKDGKSMLRYRRSGSFCTLYEQEAGFHLLIVLGAKEREKFEARAGEFLPETLRQYEAATTFHDGKWVYFNVEDGSVLEDYKKILAIKRRPRPEKA